jgi:hypothetical protein
MRTDTLDGTRWSLEYLSLGGVIHMVSGRRIPEIAFVDGRVSMDDGVNLAEGTYTYSQDGFGVTFEPTTSLRYPAEALPEHDLFEHLALVADAVVHADFLHLHYGDQGDELVYRYEPEGAPA